MLPRQQNIVSNVKSLFRPMRGNSTLEDETYYIEGKTQILSVPSFFLLLLKRTCMLNIPQKNLKPENQTTG
jgi:hypothetical protein